MKEVIESGLINMKRIIPFLIVVFFVIDCTKTEKKENSKILIFSYRILETEEFKFNNTQEVHNNVAKVLLNIPALRDMSKAGRGWSGFAILTLLILDLQST